MNRITSALQALGGRATTGEIAAYLRVPGANVSAQIAGMERRGDVMRAGTKCAALARWDGNVSQAMVTVWALQR